MRARPIRPRRFLVPVALVPAAGVLLAGLLLASSDGTTIGSSEAMPASTRRPAPALEGDVLVPPPITLADLRGNPVVVNFWASWCVPCRDEASELARFHSTMSGRATLIGVNFQDVRSDALAFVRRFRWTFSNIEDPRGKLAAPYGLGGLPTTVVIDSGGRIAAQLTGPQTFETLVQAVEEAG